MWAGNNALLFLAFTLQKLRSISLFMRGFPDFRSAKVFTQQLRALTGPERRLVERRADSYHRASVSPR
jgi:hypothetical protein